MKQVISVALICLAAFCVQAQSWQKAKAPEKSEKWLDDFEAAKKDAVTFKQPILVLFTGSDWCPWCMKLDSEVLATKAFKKFAADNLILLLVDFPQGKKLSGKVQKQNDALKAKYRPDGFPTVVLLDADGKELGRTGYLEGGGEAYVKHLKELLHEAGVQVTDKPEANKSVSAYERMKTGKAAQPAAQSK